MMIDVREEATWTEARCPRCQREAVVLWPRVSAELTCESLRRLIAHARQCRAVREGFPPLRDKRV